MSPPGVFVKAALGFLVACTWTVSSFLIVPRRHRASSSISLASEEATGEVLPNKYWVDIYKDETNKIPWDIGGAQPQVMEEAAENSFRGLSILDCGCGKGENAEHILSDQGGASSLVGFDLSPAAVAIARERKLKSAYFHAASATDLLSTNEIQERGPFDVALDSALLHCLSDEDAQRYVDGVAKLLKKNGKFFVGCFSDQNPDPWSNPRRLSEERLRRLLEDSFKVESIESVWWARPDERGSNQGSFCLAYWVKSTRK